MTLNVYGTIGLIVITLALNAVTVEGDCMAAMSKMGPIKKAASMTYKEMCGNCNLQVVQAEIDAAFEKGGLPLLDKIASFLICNEKGELVEGLKGVVKTCLSKLKDGKSMCQKKTFDDFGQCVQDEAKEKDIMKKAMRCCNNPGFTDIYKMSDCAILDTVAGLKDKKLIDKSVKEWDKAKLKCESGVTGYEELKAALLDYMKNCGPK